MLPHLVALGVLTAYLSSLGLNPWTKCRRCKGAGRHHGWVWHYAWHPCGRCAGSGRKLRWGVRSVLRTSARNLTRA